MNGTSILLDGIERRLHGTEHEVEKPPLFETEEAKREVGTETTRGWQTDVEQKEMEELGLPFHIYGNNKERQVLRNLCKEYAAIFSDTVATQAASVPPFRV